MSKPDPAKETPMKKPTVAQLFDDMRKMNDRIATSDDHETIRRARRQIDRISAELTRRGW